MASDKVETALPELDVTDVDRRNSSALMAWKEIVFEGIHEHAYTTQWNLNCRTRQLREKMALIASLQAQLKSYQEAYGDKQRLARAIDVAMHGEEDAAPQASLCDLVGPARDLRLKVASLQAENTNLRARALLAKGGK
jgi:hypothetical protein